MPRRQLTDRPRSVPSERRWMINDNDRAERDRHVRCIWATCAARTSAGSWGTTVALDPSSSRGLFSSAWCTTIDRLTLVLTIMWIPKLNPASTSLDELWFAWRWNARRRRWPWSTQTCEFSFPLLLFFFFFSFLGLDRTNNIGNCEPRCLRFTANVPLFLLWILGNEILRKFTRHYLSLSAVALRIIFLANLSYIHLEN